jgi:GNAT superfamily N-acetyltransferase
MKMIFREARTEDIPAMSELRLSVRENALSDPGRITFEMYEDYLDERGRTWLCEIDGKIAGFSTAAAQDATIWALFVREKHEGKGVGTRLLQIAVDWLFENGAESVSLSTAIATRADKFYASSGWTRGALTGKNEVIYTLKKP